MVSRLLCLPLPVPGEVSLRQCLSFLLVSLMQLGSPGFYVAFGSLPPGQLNGEAAHRKRGLSLLKLSLQLQAPPQWEVNGRAGSKILRLWRAWGTCAMSRLMLLPASHAVAPSTSHYTNHHHISSCMFQGLLRTCASNAASTEARWTIFSLLTSAVAGSQWLVPSDPKSELFVEEGRRRGE